ncbi:MAG: class I SAM-dependent methyltransferase [Vulcanimicrobiaceae bacterium]
MRLFEFLRRRKPPRRFVWEELSSPRSAHEKGSGPGYYDQPRPELVELIRGTPRFVLDVGCAGGAMGTEIKRRYSGAVVWGIELNSQAAAAAKARIDRVLSENVERFDFGANGIAPASIDLVFFPDVLEHLYNPWTLLARIKPFLAPNAQIIASIPNVRNFVILEDLANGIWRYAEEGLLDITHIRFFTRRSVIELFEQTGYRIERLQSLLDGRTPDPSLAPGARLDFETPTVTYKNLDAASLEELRTFQFLVDATPI